MKTGLIFVILGIILMGVSTVYPMFTIPVRPSEPFAFSAVYPAWDYDHFVGLFGGRKYDLIASVKDTSGIPSSVQVRIHSEPWGTMSIPTDYDQTFNIPYSEPVPYADTYRFKLSKTFIPPTDVPTNTLLVFDWTAINHAENQTITVQTRAVVDNETPEGYCEVNGERVYGISVVVVNDPNLTIKFYATQYGQDLQYVWIDVERPDGGEHSLHLTRIGEVTAHTSTWQTRWNLPVHGRTKFIVKVRRGGTWFLITKFYVRWPRPENVDNLDETEWDDAGETGENGLIDGDGDGDSWGFPEANRLTFIGLGLIVVGVVISFIPSKKW